MRVTLRSIAVLCAGLMGQTQADNDYPIILLHGLAGWGRDEAFGIKYWGAINGDIQERWKSQGAQVFTPANGPLSSSWDRTCETYAQIKGTKVDYGVTRSSHNGDLATLPNGKKSRFGRDYTGKGFYPEWGEINPQTGMRNKIHLVGHSMGGIDSDLLTHLLNNGDPAECPNGNCPAGTSNLFKGGNDWIASVTALATPHDGTLAADTAGIFNTLITGLIAAVTTLAGGEIGSDSAPLYDLKLDQHGLSRQSGESTMDYVNRALDSPLFSPGFTDSALYDLTVDGSLARHKVVECVNNVHYFSWSTKATFKSWFSGKSYPEWHMFLFLQPVALILGRTTRSGNGRTTQSVNKDWWPTDGVVPTISGYGPQTGGSCTVENYNGRNLDSQSGKWIHMGTKDGWDHLDIVGLGERRINGFYDALLRTIVGLKASAPLPCTNANGCSGGSWPQPPKASFESGLSESEMGDIVVEALADDTDECAGYNSDDCVNPDGEPDFCTTQDDWYKRTCEGNGASSTSLSVGSAAMSIFLLANLL